MATVQNINFLDKFERLPNAPIVEAVIYWQAQASQTFEQPSLQQRLSNHFANYSNPEPLFVQSIESSSMGDGRSKFSQETQWLGFRLQDVTNHYVSQFNQTGVVFSRLAPYDQWESFLAEALKFWDLFLNLAQPVAIEQLGIRYINRIPLMTGEQPSTYLKALPLPPTGLPLTLESFFYQDVYKTPGYPYSINLVQTTQPATSVTSETALILDIGVSTATPLQLIQWEQENILQPLQEMRWFKNKVFFECITSTALERFRN